MCYCLVAATILQWEHSSTYLDIPVQISQMKFIVLELGENFDFSSRLLVNDVNLSNLQANLVTYTTVCLRASHFWRR